jgi:phospholipase C
MRSVLLASVISASVVVGCSSNDGGDGGGGHGGTGVGGAGGTGTSGVTGGGGGAGGQKSCPSVPSDPLRAQRDACTFAKGAKVADTIGLSDAARAAIPLRHLVVVMQENRSFDHYFGKLATSGQPDAEAIPPTFQNPDAASQPVKPFHLASTCLEADPPHQGAAMHAGWDGGKMDGFVKSARSATSDGHYVMGGYDATDLPFYYFLADTYAISDHYFASTLGGTWANRDYMYAGTSNGVSDTGQATIDVPTIFDALDQAGVTWAVYSDGAPRQNSLGWTAAHQGFFPFSSFIAALGDGSLPSVVFVDPGPGQDEHPAADVQLGEKWGKQIYDAAIASPLWPTLAIVYTYDESGGLADHVPPPKACLASPDQTAFDRLGVRVPMIVISPWARPHYVSHAVHEHASTLRLIELLFDLPALTGRDANSDALLDSFDFECGPALAAPPAAPAAGVGGCP